MESDPADEVSVAAAIERRLDSIDWTDELHTRGLPVVALDDRGNVRRYLPDGTSTVLPAS